MDQLLKSLVDFVDGVTFAELSTTTVAEVVRHTVDTVGCGAGGVWSTPAAAARAVVAGSGGPMLASVYGQQDRVLVDFAAFANGTANRYLDFNDFGSSGHPSDMIPAILGMAEASGASGADVVCGVYIAYEIATRLAESVPPDGTWDQGLYCSLGVAGALSKILRLSPEQTANALSLAIVPSLPLRVTRFGELSEWKAAATAHATMTASFAVRLAAEGLTGPPEPFEGKYGVFEGAWPSFDLDFASTKARPAIERASLKQFGACYWGQVAIDIAVQLRRQVDLARIASLEVATCRAAWRVIGGGLGDADQKWRPSTRETADHSMPFLVASALIDGRIDESTFADGRLADPDLLALMDRTTVVERDDLTERSTRDRCPTEITMHLLDGSTLRREQDFPHGHPANPMDDHEVRVKFENFVGRVLPRPAVVELSSLLWDLASLKNLDRVARLFRDFTAQ